MGRSPHHLSRHGPVTFDIAPAGTSSSSYAMTASSSEGRRTRVYPTHATPHRSVPVRGHRLRDPRRARSHLPLSLLQVPALARRGVPDPRHDQRLTVHLDPGRGAAESLPLLRVRREALLLRVRVESHQHVRRRPSEDRGSARWPGSGAEQRARGHFFVGSKAPWFTITDGLPQHDTWPGSHARVRETRNDPSRRSRPAARTAPCPSPPPPRDAGALARGRTPW